MKITTSQFEQAVKIGFEHGLKSALQHILTPKETEVRIKKAVIDAYNKSVIEPNINKLLE